MPGTTRCGSRTPTDRRLEGSPGGQTAGRSRQTSGHRRRLVRGRNVWGLSFSPDGRAIAYSRYNARCWAGFRSDIFVVRISGGASTRLTHDGHSEHPVWGPEWIVYRRFRYRDGLRPNGRLWVMRPDGSSGRFLARGSEGLHNGFPVFGLEPLALSEDGRRVLACQTFEFGCPRVTFTVPGGTRYGFPRLERLERERGGSPTDISSDGSRGLVDVGSPHDDDHDLYEIRFTGGRMRLVVRDALGGRWRR